MPSLGVISSEMLDRIAHTLVRAPDAGMANASLLRWYAKAACYAREPLLAVTDDLLAYASDGQPPDRLARLVSDFPAMFSWFGRDIVNAEVAKTLLRQIHTSLAEASDPSFQPHEFCASASRQLHACGVCSIVESLLGIRYDFAELRLVVIRDPWDPFYVLSNTVVCSRDKTLSTYAAMIAHETTHILTLSLVNDPVVTAGIPREITFPMAEALAQAVQMLTTERCGISYEALFPGGAITDHQSYLRAHPDRARMERMIVRLMERLCSREDTPLRQLYRSALEEFAGSG